MSLSLISNSWDFEKLNTGEAVSVFLCVCVCVCLCVSLASDSSETFEGTIIRLGTVIIAVLYEGIDDSAERLRSYIRMHHVLIMLTLIFKVTHILIMTIINVRLFQKVFKQCPSRLLCCEDSPTKNVYNLCQSDDLHLHPGQNCGSNLTIC